MDEKARRVSSHDLGQLLRVRETRETSALRDLQRRMMERDQAIAARDAQRQELERQILAREAHETALYRDMAGQPVTALSLEKAVDGLRKLAHEIEQQHQTYLQAASEADAWEQRVLESRAAYIQRLRASRKTTRTRDRVADAKARWGDLIGEIESEDMIIDRHGRGVGRHGVA